MGCQHQLTNTITKIFASVQLRLIGLIKNSGIWVNFNLIRRKDEVDLRTLV